VDRVPPGGRIARREVGGYVDSARLRTIVSYWIYSLTESDP
jgi:hypothetical protein